MPTLQTVLNMKGTGSLIVPKGTSVHRAIELMSHEGIGSVLIKDGELVLGILSERDMLRRVLYRGLDARTTSVEEVMTREMELASPDLSVHEALARMTARRQRYLVVGQADRFLGVVSLGDVAKCAARELDRCLEEMARYVGGPCARHDSGWPSAFPSAAHYAEDLEDDLSLRTLGSSKQVVA